MNNTASQKGFKTFVLTLSISLIVFSVIYYFVSESQMMGEEVVIENYESREKPVAAGASTTESAFKKLATAEVQVPQKAVLAGTDTNTTPATTTTTTTADVTESTTAAVPTTGVTEISLGLMFSALAFLAGLIVISKNPRKLALESFEKKVTRE